MIFDRLDYANYDKKIYSSAQSFSLACVESAEWFLIPLLPIYYSRSFNQLVRNATISKLN